MKLSRTLWNLVQILSIVSFLLLVGGFAYAVKDILQPVGNLSVPTQSVKNQTPSTTQGGLLLSFGDSLTRGIGDPKGEGYIGITHSKLQEKSPTPLTLINLAVSGAISSELLAQLDQPQVQNFLQEAKWISFTIGGNDLFRSSNRLEQVDEATSDEARKQYSQNLKSILTKMREQNKTAPIFLFGLYNPFGDLEDEKRTSTMVAEWNEEMLKVSSQFDNVVVIPTFDLFQLDPNRYLYTDHFHPNEKGYERMASRLLQVIEDLREEPKK
ncbi:GDSL-type esterase/lipase family protein [Risungbinella massiliensis]|uniref:GDSL-type esterase/lipase family protein n=1 Tax=Risungbinella massiliensis TaxID=1329796 RepID=UPI0005CC40E1|nr:GDSL-type esterase/lipase family protein [Risungbinella massiliensis]